MGSLLKIRTGNRLNCSLGVVVAKAAHFLDIEGSLLKNWDWESIELLTGGCSSVEGTIREFSGAILIFWLVLTYWLDWLMHQNFTKNSELSSS